MSKWKMDYYKFCFLDSNELPYRYVLFLSENERIESTSLSEFFSNVEWKYIMENQLEKHIVVSQDIQIYPDDSILTIKKKIIRVLDSNSGYEQEKEKDLYLFSAIEQTFHPLSLFKRITQQDTKPFTKPKLNQVMMNYYGVSKDVNNITQDKLYADNNVFSYEDLLEMDWFYGDKLENNTILRKQKKIPLGFRFVESPHNVEDDRVVLNQDLFSSNPFDILFPYVYRPSKDVVLQSFDSDFLFHYAEGVSGTFGTEGAFGAESTGGVSGTFGTESTGGTGGTGFIENTIYVCTYDEVNTFLNNKNIDKRTTDEILSTYFPNRDGKDTETGSSEKKKTTVDTMFWEQEKNIHLIYNLSEKNTKIIKGGIYAFQFIIHPNHPIQLPLETIFKNIHASIEIPFIQYSPVFIPGLMREKMYRLYYEEVAQNGNKIPFLSPSQLQSLTKKNQKNENITMFIAIEDFSDIFLRVIFESNGNIMVELEMNRSSRDISIPPEKINEWIGQMISPAIYQINTFTKASGFSVSAFSSLQDESIEIIFLHYLAKTELEKKVDIEKCMQLFSPLFYNELEKGKDTNTILKRYKRVEYFQAMNKYEEYISELLRFTQQETVLISELHRKYISEISVGEAREILDKYQDKYKNVVIPSSYTNKRIEMLAHTGFPVIFKKSNFENEWTVDIRNIFAMEYIFLLQKYLNVFFMVSQYGNTEFNKLLKDYDINIKKNVSSSFVSNLKPVIHPVVPIFSSEKDTVHNIGFLEEGTDQFGLEPVVINPEEEYEIPEEYETEEEEEEEEEEKKKEKGGSSRKYTKTEKPKTEKKPKSEKKPKPEKKVKKNTKSTNDTEGTDDEDDDEEDDDEEDEGVDDDEDEGTEGTEDAESPDVPGKELKNLNTYFMKRFKKRFPLLINNGFTRICAANAKRQPIILTDREKQKIDKEYQGKNKPYSHALQYGVDKEYKEPLHYVCPAYWCIKPGQEGPLTEEEVKNKKCGEIIQNPKKLKPGEYTYKWKERFTEPGIVNRKRDIVIDPKTGKEICFPCCFKEWNGKAQFERRNECNPEEYPLHAKKKKAQEKRLMMPSSTRNILDMTYIPLPYGRIGVLPVAIQLFLNEHTSSACIDSQNMPKLNCPLMVRYGAVQSNYENQYFLACLADIYSYQRNEVLAKPIPEMREILCSAISLDLFIQLQNASLVSLFRYSKDGFVSDETLENSHVLEYQTSEFYRRLDPNSETHMDFFESTIQSYEHFLQYLRDPESIIDTTYLWEAICQKNPALLPRGVNMAIIEITDADTTNNVDLICPSCAYATLYDPAKETWILMKKGAVYEPIYVYEITNLNPEKTSYQKTFRSNSKNKDINIILKMLQEWITRNCHPISRKPKGYVFERNISAKEIWRELGEGFQVNSAVLNYQNKIIGLLVDVPTSLSTKIPPSLSKKKPKTEIYIPTFPSSMIPKLPTKWMDEPELWNDYTTTVFLLQEIYRVSEQKILSKPLYRVVEDEMVVGIITMTNQFVQIHPYEENRDFQDGLITLEDNNPIEYDKDLTLPVPSSRKRENERSLESKDPKTRMVRNIRLETQFYNSFRNTIRIVLNLYKSRNVREKIREIIFTKEKTYQEKIVLIETELRELSKSYFTFQDYSENVLDRIQDVFVCYGGCDATKSNYCLLSSSSVKGTEEELCQLILPKNNLVNDMDNQRNYFLRLSDEFIRLKRVRLFMMYPDTYLQISSGEYKIYENEFVIPRSILTEEYFDELKSYKNPKYVRRSTFETTNPNTGIPANPTLLWKDAYTQQTK